MRLMMHALRSVGGCWFWIVLLVAITTLFVNNNVATGEVHLATRLAVRDAASVIRPGPHRLDRDPSMAATAAQRASRFPIESDSGKRG